MHVPAARDEDHDRDSRPEIPSSCQGFLSQRTPWGVYSRTIPPPSSSSRIASAALKSRAFRACFRASMRSSIQVSSTSGDSDEDFLEGEEGSGAPAAGVEIGREH